MPSLVWGRDPQEAFEDPYEYEAQEQFAREASAFFARLYRVLNDIERFRYFRDDRSAQKAVWLLGMDTLDALRDCLTSLGRKEHRLAGRLFRDAIETMDLAAYFHSGTSKSLSSLERWYDDKIVPNSEYRDYVRRTLGVEAAKILGGDYSNLSRFTHRSYRAIMDAYSLGGETRLVHDRTAELYGTSEDPAKFLVVPHTIASYYAVLASLIAEYASHLPRVHLVSREAVQAAFAQSMEPETVKRRFRPARWVKKPGRFAAEELDKE